MVVTRTAYGNITTKGVISIEESPLQEWQTSFESDLNQVHRGFNHAWTESWGTYIIITLDNIDGERACLFKDSHLDQLLPGIQLSEDCIRAIVLVAIPQLTEWDYFQAYTLGDHQHKSAAQSLESSDQNGGDIRCKCAYIEILEDLIQANVLILEWPTFELEQVVMAQLEHWLHRPPGPGMPGFAIERDPPIIHHAMAVARCDVNAPTPPLHRPRECDRTMRHWSTAANTIRDKTIVYPCTRSVHPSCPSHEAILLPPYPLHLVRFVNDHAEELTTTSSPATATKT